MKLGTILQLLAATMLWPVDLPAQSFTMLCGLTNYNTEGAFPVGGLILAGDTLYGTAEWGGCFGGGTLIKVNTNGSGFTVLHNFAGPDGDYPCGNLLLSGNTLYGTTQGGGNASDGTVFKVNTDGSNFVTLHSFIWATNGASPNGGLVLSGGTLYGTASGGGTGANGTVFKVNTDGSGFAALHQFTAGLWDTTNSDGMNPGTALVLSNDVLYGTAGGGGSGANGTVFKLNTNGTGFTVLYNFTATPGPGCNGVTNSDGICPVGLILSGNTLYGAAQYGGGAGGTVFKLNTDGSGFTTLRSFAQDGVDGSAPLAGVVLSDGVLYGTASGGGLYGQGTLFRLNTDGTGFATLHSFAGTGDGGAPRAPLVVVGDTYYGTTSSSRVALYGTLFAFTPDVAPAPIPLNYQAVGGELCLTWTNPSFCLQISRSVNGVYTNIPTASSPWFVPTAAPQVFFRLQAN